MTRLFGPHDDLSSVESRHLRVGGKPGSEVVPCDCGKAKPRKICSLKPWEFKDQQAMEEALRRACHHSKETEVL
jgi:hypothetical protein